MIGATSPPQARAPFWPALATVFRISPAIAYVLRTLLAMGLAFYAALWLQLGTPASAAVTVMIVANPSRGGIISKGVWRIFGTVTGAVAGVIMMAAFGQTPLLFIIALGLWLGICTFASSMFRHFRAYAAVLSGYTVALVTAGAVPAPDHVLGFALGRLAAVTLGVVVSTAVTMIFQPTVTTDGMRARARASLRGVATLLLCRADGTPMDDPGFIAERTRLASEIERLDEAVEFSGVEATDVNRHAASLRRGLAALYAALLSVSIAGHSLNRLAEVPVAQAARTPEEETEETREETGQSAVTIVTRVRGLLQEIARYDPQSRQAPLALAETIAGTAAALTALQGAARSLEDTTTIARVHQELEQLYDATVPFGAWRAGLRPYHRGRPLTAFRDYATATRNGARSFIAVVLGGCFSYFTAWDMGPTLMIILAASCALLSGAPSAAAASIQFAKGITLATVAAALYEFLILPHLTNFPILALAVLPVLAVAVYGTTIPRYALLCLGFVIFFITQLNFANQMTYDVVAFANAAVAFLLGAWGTVLVFRVILPPNPMRDAAYLVRRIRHATERLIKQGGGRHGARDWLGWLVTQNQAMQRLFMRLQVNPALRSRSIGDCGALLIITQEALRLKSLLRALDLPAAEQARVAEALTHLTRLRRPRRAAASAEAASLRLRDLYEAGGASRPALLQAAGSFRTIAAMMPQAEGLLALEAPLPVVA
ncbi:FUSC family protein [Acidisoma sp. 7E03]